MVHTYCALLVNVLQSVSQNVASLMKEYLEEKQPCISRTAASVRVAEVKQ